MQEKVLIKSEPSVFLKNQLTITNVRFYGKTVWGKRINFPIVSIKSVGNGFFQGITINSEYGKFHFKFIRNYKEFPKVVSEFLITQRENNAKGLMSVAC